MTAQTDRVIEIARMVLQYSNQDLINIDFDDMLYLTLRNGAPVRQYDNVFVDEAQDTNAVQRALLHRMVRPGGRLIAVGDRGQAIYGFRGTDSDAMEQMQEEFNATELPLSISYRCPQSVVRAAQEYVGIIKASPTAIEGEVKDIAQMNVADFRSTDAVLCRNTAPLVSLAYRLITRRVPVRILGREIGDGLVALIKRLSAKSLDHLLEKLAAYEDKEVAKLVGRKKETAAQAVQDKCNSIRAFVDSMDQNSTIDQLITEIKSLFERDDVKGDILTLATVHKSKGREWPRVYILDRHLMPSKWARQAWQHQQEANLIYVAYTRAMESLYFINSNGIE